MEGVKTPPKVPKPPLTDGITSALSGAFLRNGFSLTATKMLSKSADQTNAVQVRNFLAGMKGIFSIRSLQLVCDGAFFYKVIQGKLT